jgi:hypothetical protein
MRKLLFIGIAALAISCGQSNNKHEEQHTDTTATVSNNEAQYFGDKISEDGAMDIAGISTQMGDKKEMNAKLTATIEAVCQKKGCWMDLKTADGGTMRVTFKDYAFFVPKDAAGKQAVVEGVAKIEETSVADQKEYAKDAGKSKEEIEAIKEPKKELVFEANGVIIK